MMDVVRAIELRQCEVLCYEDGHLLWTKKFPDRVRAKSFYKSIVDIESAGPVLLKVHHGSGIAVLPFAV